ncbi:MAG: hydroxymethylglutaryl-CoA lyase [Chloroflexi bacterium]|nr:hydroxymethylglutaryl-CoA lyase [Chloroflexota bacterium]
MAAEVRIVEVGPRDGLQNERAPISTVDKIRFIDLLSEAGFGWIEVTSFVHPRAVPQMADADEVLRAIHKRPGTRYVALVPNPRGLARALAADVQDIALFVAATESFSRANINRSIAESLADARAVIDGAKASGARVRAYISVAFGCPYEGPVTPAQVRPVAEQLLDRGVEEVVLGDTIGIATPPHVGRLMDTLVELAPAEQWGLHFHDTRGMALANVMRSLERGVRNFDSSAGGLGGCPFAGPGAAGNVATEDLLYLLDGLGVQHGVDLDKVLDASRFIVDAVGHPLTSKVYQAGGRLTSVQPLARRGRYPGRRGSDRG